MAKIEFLEMLKKAFKARGFESVGVESATIFKVPHYNCRFKFFIKLSFYELLNKAKYISTSTYVMAIHSASASFWAFFMDRKGEKSQKIFGYVKQRYYPKIW